MKKELKIVRVQSEGSEFFERAVMLFDGYRQFYKQASDVARARLFLADHINNFESEIFLALDEASNAIGFMQLYRGFSSVGMRKIYVLNDLYVVEESRGKGVGRFLIEEAKKFAAQNNVTKITLTTAKTNRAAQSLYEAEGYVKDEDYLVYNLEVVKKF